MSNMKMSTSQRYDEDSRSDKFYKITTTLINFTNMVLFGTGLLLFIIGLQYLTTYRYKSPLSKLLIKKCRLNFNCQ